MVESWFHLLLTPGSKYVEQETSPRNVHCPSFCQKILCNNKCRMRCNPVEDDGSRACQPHAPKSSKSQLTSSNILLQHFNHKYQPSTVIITLISSLYPKVSQRHCYLPGKVSQGKKLYTQRLVIHASKCAITLSLQPLNLLLLPRLRSP